MINAINRNIPLTTYCNILFGGILNTIGWLVFGIGMVFFWGFAMNADLSFLHYQGTVITVQGKVTDSFETNAEVNESSIYEIHYKFTTNQQIDYDSYSYSTGRGMAVGSPVSVEYPDGNPEYSRIRGLRREMFGWPVLFVSIIPLIGLGFIYFAVKKAKHANNLLKHGILTQGKLISKVPTNTRINEQLVYKFTFAFTDNNGRKHKVIGKTHVTHLLEDDVEENILYIPKQADKAILVDILPASPKINEDGTIDPASIASFLKALFIPALVIGLHGSYVFFGLLAGG